MTPVIRVGVVGGAGRMGRDVCRAVRAAPDLVLAAVIDPRGASGAADARDAGDAVLGDADPLDGAVVSGELGALVDARTDVAVDFSTADAARGALPWCAAQGIHAVVGTTGLGADDMEMLARCFTGEPANAVVAANFAIGAVLLMRLSELAAPHMGGAEVIELHHDNKRDAPSGTAMRTAERIAAARAAVGADAFGPDPTAELVLDGARGAAGPGGVRIHSVRLPGLVAHQEVLFGALGQSLTIRHDSYDRASFMPGVLLAVRAVRDRPGLTVGLEPLLGL